MQCAQVEASLWRRQQLDSQRPQGPTARQDRGRRREQPPARVAHGGADALAEQQVVDNLAHEELKLATNRGGIQLGAHHLVNGDALAVAVGTDDVARGRRERRHHL